MGSIIFFIPFVVMRITNRPLGCLVVYFLWCLSGWESGLLAAGSGLVGGDTTFRSLRVVMADLRGADTSMKQLFSDELQFGENLTWIEKRQSRFAVRRVDEQEMDFNYSFSPGPREIKYAGGVGKFSTIPLGKATFKRGVTYFSFDVYNNEIQGSLHKPGGQLLLDGVFQFFDGNGQLRLTEQYKAGVKHGEEFSYDSSGVELTHFTYRQGVPVYQRYTDKRGLTHVREGEKEGVGAVLSLWRADKLLKRITVLSGGREQVEVFDWNDYTPRMMYTRFNRQLNGAFEWYRPDGSVICSGKWAEGNLEGLVKVLGEGGDIIWEGSYREGKRDGLYREYTDSRVVVEGSFRDGLVEGTWKTYRFFGRMLREAEEGTFKAGQREGLFREWLGDDLTFCWYQAGEPDGPFRHYRLRAAGIDDADTANMIVVARGHFRAGRREGLWWQGLELGNREFCESVSYVAGVREGAFHRYGLPDTLLLERGAFKSGLKDGVWEIFSNEARQVLMEMRQYRRDTLVLGVIYTSEGGVAFEGVYAEGRLSKLTRYYSLDSFIQVVSIRPDTGGVFFTLSTVGDTVRQSGMFISQSDWIYLSPRDGMARFSSLKSDLQYHGAYFLTMADGLPLASGTHLFGKREGWWKDYYHNQGVLRETFFERNERTRDQFFLMDGKTFYSGKLTIPVIKDGGYLEINIRQGLREGFTSRFDREGKMIQRSNYRAGKLIK
jgi:antitoxin component YwqK of YwqJK toxin-antitoxin module